VKTSENTFRKHPQICIHHLQIKIQKMNVKVLAWIIIVLIIVFMAVYLFVPKNLDATTGSISTFKRSDDAPTTPAIQNSPTA
jgi:hypothetical protein